MSITPESSGIDGSVACHKGSLGGPELDQDGNDVFFPHDLADVARSYCVLSEEYGSRPYLADLAVTHAEIGHPRQIDQELPLWGRVPILSPSWLRPEKSVTGSFVEPGCEERGYARRDFDEAERHLDVFEVGFPLGVRIDADVGEGALPIDGDYAGRVVLIRCLLAFETERERKKDGDQKRKK
jgi:hypothetical protein